MCLTCLPTNLPKTGDNFGRINDGDRDDEDYGDGREGAEDEHEGEEDEEEEDAEDVFIPWIPCRPFRDAVHREVVRPVHVKRLLSEGGPRATLLTHTLSLRTRLRRNILEGKIDRATQLLQLEVQHKGDFVIPLAVLQKHSRSNFVCSNP